MTAATTTTTTTTAKHKKNVSLKRSCDLQLIPYGHFVKPHADASSTVGQLVYPIVYVACRLQQRPGQILASCGSCKFHGARRKKRHIKNVKYISCRLVTGAGKATGNGQRATDTGTRQQQQPGHGYDGVAYDDDDDDDKCARLWACHINICMQWQQQVVKKPCTQFICWTKDSRRLSQLQIVDETRTQPLPLPPPRQPRPSKNFAAEFNPIINGILLTSGIKLNVVISRVQRNYQAAVCHTHTHTYTHRDAGADCMPKIVRQLSYLWTNLK